VVVEEALLTRPGIFQVFPAKLPAPYPGYDKFKGGAKALAEKLVEDGYDLDAAVAYERENKNRPSFVVRRSRRRRRSLWWRKPRPR
jgi:hypothetical protein